MNRKLIIGALAGAGVLAAWTALLLTRHTPTADTTTATTAVLTPRQDRTERFWAARVTPLAGGGSAGFADGPAAAARFSDPFGVAVDPRGTVYLADGGDNNRIRRIAPDGTVSTLAGGSEGFRDGRGAQAAFNTPSAIALDHLGNLYVADTGNHAIRRIGPDGTVTTLAGNGQPGDADGKGAAASFNGPVGVAVDDGGVVYVADTYNDRIRRIAPDGTVTTLAGGARPGDADGVGGAAAFDTPSGIAVAADGTLFVADTGNEAIRRIGTDGAVTTVAKPPEGERRPALRRPTAVAATRDGYVYFTSSNGRILQLAPSGEYRPLGDVDQKIEPGYGSDGSVQLYAPRGLAVQADGALVAAEGLGLRLVRLATARGKPAVVSTASAAVVTAPAPKPRRMLWPVLPQDVPHEVVGLMGEVRGNFDGESRDHFHMGLDVRADVGDAVVAIAPAKIADPYANWGYGSLSEGMAVGTLSYIHMKVGRDRRDAPLDGRFQVLLNERRKPERVRVRRGTRFAVGDRLGTINAMAHVHLDYYPGGSVENPLGLPFIGLQDTVAPRIQSIVLLADGGKRLPGQRGEPRKKNEKKEKKRAKGKGKEEVASEPAPRGPVKVPRSLGKIDIVVDAYDQMDGNLARRRLGLYRLGYQLLRADGSPVPGYEQPRITQTYDRMPRNQEAVKVVYAPSSGITVYGSAATHFAYALHNRLADGRVTPGAWDVSSLDPGNYTLRIFAADRAGNVAVEGRDLAIAVE